MDYTIKGIEFMGDNVKDRLKYCGKGVRVHPLAKIYKPEMVELDDYSVIADFVFLWGGGGIKIGKYSKMTWHTLIEGDGKTNIGDRVFIGPGTKIITGLYDYKDGLRMVDNLPEGQARAIRGTIVIQNDVSVSANCVILPNITIGEGAVVGANSLVKTDLEPWGVYAGNPVRKIADRSKITFKD